MGVDHHINIGYGFRLQAEDLKVVDPEIDYPDEILEGVFWGSGDKYPLVTWFAGGSYYGSDPIQYAVVVKSTHERATDLEGFLDVQRPKLTTEDLFQLRSSYTELTGKDWNDDPPVYAWQIAGLWS